MNKKISKFKFKIKSLFLPERSWRVEDSGLSIKQKKYPNYEEYLKHQKSKLELVKDFKMPEYEIKYNKVLKYRLKRNHVKKGSRVLCLAARMGSEVRAFRDIGCFAVGIDLNPGKENKLVLYGDFHNLQFADNSVDLVFTNSFDHVYNLERVLREIKRVLVDKGVLILEAMAGVDEGLRPGYWESMSWNKIDDLIDIIKNYNFKLVKRTPIRYPWKGENLVFVSKKKN